MSDQLLICEQLLLVIYDDQKGRTALFDSSPAAALSGAVVLDLIVSGKLTEHDGKLAAHGSTPSHPALAKVFQAVAQSSKPRKVSHWVSKYAQTGRTERTVAAGLAERGILREENRRILGLIPMTRYPQADPRPEQQLRKRLHAVLLEDAEPTEDEAMLVGVLKAGKLLNGLVPKDRRKQAAARAEVVAEAGKSVNAAVAKAIRDIETAITAGAVVAATGAATSGC